MLPVNKTPVSQSLKDLVAANSNKGTAPKELYRSMTHTGETEYSKYDIGSFADEDMQDSRAMQQTNWEGWGNIFAANLGKTVTRTIDGVAFIPSALYSLTRGFANGEIDDASSATASIFENPISQYMRQGEEWLNTQFPVYQTKAQERSYSPFNLGFANSVMDGLSYVASMYAGGSTLRAASKFGAKAWGKIFANAIEEGKDMAYVAETFGSAAAKTEELGRIDGLLKKTGDTVRKNFYDYWGGVVESGAEAAETRKTVYDNLLNDYRRQNGGQEPTDEQKALAKDRSDEAGALNFAANMMTTTIANKMVFGKMFKTRWADEMVAHNQLTKEGGKYALTDAKGRVDKYLKLFKGHTAKDVAAEAGQEGTQFASNDFFVNLYSNPSAESVWKIDNVAESLSSTLGDLRSKDAVHSMLVGGLIGGGAGALFNRGKDQQIRANTQRYIDMANNATTEEVLRSMAKNVDVSNAMEGAVISGDRLTYETLKANQAFDWAYSRHQLKKTNDLKAELDEARAMSLDDFKEKYDIEDADYTEEQRKSYLDYMGRVAEDTVNSASNIMSRYGHKITAMANEAPDMLKYLTMVDVHKKDYIRRETELLTKLAPHMSYEDLQKSVLTDERLGEIQTRIKELETQFADSKNLTANTPEELTAKTQKMTDVTNEIVSLQNVIASSVTEANYKDMMQLDNLDEKRKKAATEKTTYQEYSKDLKDLKNIQVAKEQLINYYNKIVNNTDYAKKVQNQINIANQSQLLDNMFTLNLKVADLEKTRKNKDGIDESYTEKAFVEAGTDTGDVQDFVKPGDIYSLNREYTTYDRKNKSYRNFERYMPFEVMSTRVDMNGQVPVGMVQVQSADGRTLDLSMNEFRRSLRPIQAAGEYKDYKYRLPKEEERFYKLFRDNAIKYQTGNGQIITGMLGFNQYTPGLVLKYFNEEGKPDTVNFNPTEYRKGEGGYLEILDREQTLAFKLKDPTTNYIEQLKKELESTNKSRDTTTAHLERITKRLADLNGGTDAYKATQSIISSYSRFIDELSEDIEIKNAALERLERLKAIPFEPSESYPPEINEAIEDLTKYYDAARNLSLEAKGDTPKQIRDRDLKSAMTWEIDGNEQSINEAKTHIKDLKQQYVNIVSSALRGDNSDAGRQYLANITDANLNPRLDDQYLAGVQAAQELGINTPVNSDTITETTNLLNNKVRDVRDRIRDIHNGYRDKILNTIGEADNLRDKYEQYRHAEFAAIVRYGIFVNSTGYWPRKTYGKDRKVTETDYNVDNHENDVTRRPTFVLKSTTSGSTTNPHKRAFQDNLPNFSASDLSARVIPESEYGKYSLDANGTLVDGIEVVDPIYVALTDKSGNDITVQGAGGTLSLITSLPLPTLSDTYGSRFADAEAAPRFADINSALNTVFNPADPDGFTERLNTVKQSILDNPDYDDADKLYATKAAAQLESLNAMRQSIKGTGGTLMLEVTGKSNGKAELGNDNTSKYINDTGSIIIAESPTTYIGEEVMKTTPGRAYWSDPSKQLFFPVIVDRLGNNKMKYGNYEKSFVDNIIDGGKFVAASAKGKAFFTAGTGVRDQKLLSDALTEVNNFLSYFVFQNRNEAKPHSVFTFDYNGNDVIFRIGADSFNLSIQEAEIRERLQKRLFNIDKKSLGKDRFFPLFRALPDGEVHITFKQKVNYDALVRDTFGVKTNIKRFNSGYVTFSGKVTPKAVAAPITVPEAFDPDDLIAAGGKVVMSGDSGTPFGTGAIPLPSSLSAEVAPEPKPGEQRGFRNRLRPTPPSTSSAPVINNSALEAPSSTPAPEETQSGSRFKKRNLSFRYYEGNTAQRLSGKQWAEIRNRFENKYGVEFNIVKGLVDNDALGQVTAAAQVLMSDEAPRGVDRHEEFHLVSQHILNSGERDALYDAQREQDGDSEADLDTIEERLATNYDLYTRGYDGIIGKLKELFDAFISKMRKIVGLKPRIKDVYVDIYRGKYYGRPVYAGTTSYKMKRFENDNRNELEKIPEQERLKGYKAATSNFVKLMRATLAERIGKSEEEEALTSLETRTPELEQQLAYLQQQRQLQALTRLVTNRAERNMVLNSRTQNGEPTFEVLLYNSLVSYIEGAKDSTAAKFLSATDPRKPNGDKLFDEAMTEFAAVVSKELNLIMETEDLDEYNTDRSVVKKGDTEVDFFQESTTALKLLAYTQMQDNNVYPINVATLNKIYFEKLSNKTSDNDFFQTLRTLGNDPSVAANYGNEYKRAVDGISQLAGLFKNPVDATMNDVLLQQMLYGIFNKQEVSYQVLKIVDQEEGQGLNYYFVDQSKEKNREETKKEFISGLRINYEGIKNNPGLVTYREVVEALKANKNNQEAAATYAMIEPEAKHYVFNQLTGLDLNTDIRKEYPSIDNILNHFIMFKGTATEYMNKNSKNLNTFVEIISGKNKSKIFSIMNARRNPQFSLQSPSSIHEALNEYKENLPEEEGARISLDSFVNLNGTQYTAKAGKKSQETKYAAASDLLNSDLLSLYYEAVMSDTNPMIPYIFNGDKSSIGGFKLKGEFLSKGSEAVLTYQDIQRSILRKEMQDLANILKLQADNSSQKLGFAAQELPFYTFLKGTASNLYDDIKSDVVAASKENDVERAIDSVFAKYEEPVLKATYNYMNTVAAGVGQEFSRLGYRAGQISNNDLVQFANRFALANYEQTKLTGSLAFYKDPAKRLYAWTSAKSAMNTNKGFLDWYNARYDSSIDTNFRSLVVDDIRDFTEQVDSKGNKLWKGNNPSDAQAWITLDTARFMLMASGKFNHQLDELFYAIEQIDELNNPTAQDLEDLNEYTRELGEQLNVLKPQSFANQDINGIQVPTFYKFSVFPLTKTASKGKNLGKMLDIMQKNNINILMVDSANKVGRIKGTGMPMYDENGNFVLEFKEQNVQTTPWKGLGLQVDMPNRHHTVSAGTQARKLITENLNYLGDDAVYTIDGKQMTGAQVRDEHERLIKIKLVADETKVRTELGIGEDFEVTEKNLPQVKRKILQLANLSASTSFGLLEDIKNLGSYDFTTNKAKLQGIFNSLFSKGVIKQKINGDSKAMVSSVGFERANDTIKQDNRLKFYEDADGKRHMEVYLPFTQMAEYAPYTYYDKETGMYYFKTPKEGQEEFYDNLMSVIGFRIPTQAQASIENIKIKGFLPQYHGNAIVVPFELTSKAGSDFDIDKLNLYMPKFTKGKYDYGDVDNQLLRFYRDLMSSPAYYPLYVKSIDGGSLERIAKDIEAIKVAAGQMDSKGDNTNYYNFFNPLYLTNRRYSFISAKDTLGAAALATTHHAESQKHGLGWRERSRLGGSMVTNRLDGTVNSLGELLSKFVSDIVVNDTIRFDRVFMLRENGTNSTEYISDKLSEFVNAFVDAAKDDYITTANVDLKTISVAMMLTRAGIPESMVLNFLAQPGVVAYTKALKEGSSFTRGNIADQKIDELFPRGSAANAPVDVKTLKASLTDDAFSPTQANYIQLYRELNKYADQLSKVQQVTSFDTKATDKMIELNEINLMKYYRYMANEAKYWEGLNSMTNEDTSFQAAMREVAKRADKFNAEFFNIKYLYNSALSTGRSIANSMLEGKIREIQNEERTSADDKVYRISRINNFFITWLAQKQAAKSLPGGEKELAGKVQSAIAKLQIYNGQNQFVRGLRVIDKRIYSHSSAALSADELNERQAAFQELMYEDLDLAKDIIYAGVAGHGFVNNPFSYMNQIPGSLILEAIGVNNFSTPLLEIYSSLSSDELTRGVNNAQAFAERGYSDVVSNFVLEGVDSAPRKLDEPYTC